MNNVNKNVKIILKPKLFKIMIIYRYKMKSNEYNKRCNIIKNMIFEGNINDKLYIIRNYIDTVNKNSLKKLLNE